jgi:hypothetical protein
VDNDYSVDAIYSVLVFEFHHAILIFLCSTIGSKSITIEEHYFSCLSPKTYTPVEDTLVVYPPKLILQYFFIDSTSKVPRSVLPLQAKLSKCTQTRHVRWIA